jgi:hypothetical protein
LQVVGGLGFPACAADEPVAESHRKALVVFLSYRANTPLALPATRMRLLGTEALASALADSLNEIVTYPELEPLQRQWRVRSDRDLSAGFLEGLEGSFSVDRLIVANLLVYPDRLILLTREIEVGSGRVIAADVAEEFSGSLSDNALEALENWRQVTRKASRSIVRNAREVPPAAGAGVLVLLPMRPVGIGQGQVDMATNCLLRSLIESGSWLVPEPSLVESALEDDGFVHAPLVAGARQALASRYEPMALLMPHLVSFGEQQLVLGAGLHDEDYDGGISLVQAARTPMYLALLVVDAGSGSIVSGGSEYLEPVDPIGVFGVLREARVVGRLKAGTDRLVQVLPEMVGDG